MRRMVDQAPNQLSGEDMEDLGSMEINCRVMMKVKRLRIFDSFLDVEAKLKSMLTQVAQGQEPPRP